MLSRYPAQPVLLELSTTHAPAGDLGFLLHKHPGRLQAFSLAFGQAHVFYPEVSDERCTAALLLDNDPVGLVRGKDGERTLDQYVNDRPYVASSMLAVAISQVFRSALSGACKERPELAEARIPLQARIASIPCRGRAAVLEKLFGPLGYDLAVETRALEPTFPEWGEAPVCAFTIAATCRLSEMLSHLYVLIPVLDDEKHYWVGEEEVEKLLRFGEGWLSTHPEREMIARRYQKHRRSLATNALRRLREQDGEAESDTDASGEADAVEEVGERKLSLHEHRHGTILAMLEARKVQTVVDLGCGEGRLLRELLKRPWLKRIVGVDVSHRALEIAADRLHLEEMTAARRKRIELIHGSLLYCDARIAGFDAAVLCEVIEHLDEPRLAAMERVVFGEAQPGLVLVTTPNREYNAKWETLASGSMRHRDHRFEWTRAEFAAWAERVGKRFGYAVECRPVGEEDALVGAPTQMGVFTRGS